MTTTEENWTQFCTSVQIKEILYENAPVTTNNNLLSTALINPLLDSLLHAQKVAASKRNRRSGNKRQRYTTSIQENTQTSHPE